MEKVFKYSLLKYRPSYLLGEQVNIGILFLFLEDNHVAFSFPNSLKRLTALYPDIVLNETKSYLNNFRLKAKKLSAGNLFLAAATENLIENEFLIADANSFFFSEFKVGVYTGIEKTIEHLNKQYFAYYDALPQYALKTDADLIQKITEGIRRSGKSARFKTENVKLENSKITSRFDLSWQNGTTNFAKALSFDLKKPESIQHKAIQKFGELYQLGTPDSLKDKRFDFLVAEPSDRSLFKTYTQAIDILESIPHNKRIITEIKFDDYIEEALETSKVLF